MKPPGLLAFLACVAPLACAAPLDPADAEALFVRRVQPLFAEKCISCHGQDEAKIKGGLDLRTQAAFLIGGDSGPSIDTANIPKSPILLAVLRQSEDFEAMPPKEADNSSVAAATVCTFWPVCSAEEATALDCSVVA